MPKSEFGKGLVICLVKFAEHMMDLRYYLGMYERMRKESNHPDLFSESKAIELWANAASDHLYDIEAPKGKEWDEIRKKVGELREKGLVMGHSFASDSVWAQENAEELGEMARDIALMIDRKLGLKPDRGHW